MSDKKKIILCTVCVLLVIAVILLCTLPWATPIDVTLDAVKLDESGNAVGTAQITIRGRRLDYLFKDSRMDITIESFYPYTWFKLIEDTNTGKVGIIRTSEHYEAHSIGCYAWETATDQMTMGTLGFSPDLDCWLLTDTHSKVCYVASVSGNSTAQELLEYFQLLLPFSLDA